MPNFCNPLRLAATVRIALACTLCLTIAPTPQSFADGSPQATGESAEHRYEKVGRYTPSVTGKDGKGETYMVSFNSKQSPGDVDTYYKEQLASHGWTIASQGTYGASSTISATQDTRTVSVIVADHGTGGTTASGTGVVLNVGPKPA